MEIFHTCTENPAHKAWGIYQRSKKAKPTKPFTLAAICLNYGNAVGQAKKLTEESTENDFSVQGAELSDQLPEKYIP